MPVFSCVVSLVITEAISTSLAVPADVVMHTIGSAGFSGCFFPPFADNE